jgi:hypothetical protein
MGDERRRCHLANRIIISSLTMKITHNQAQMNATGHARNHKRMSHSNENIGFDAIFSVVPSALMGRSHVGGYFKCQVDGEFVAFFR